MTNNLQYEERLGTAPMVPLVFRMVLPAVVAQLVNLLYNLVDRIYIGHIYGIGTDALAIMQSAMMLVSVPLSGFAQGFIPIASYNYGRGDALQPHSRLADDPLPFGCGLDIQ